jgi:hypothetical protein
VAWHVTAWLFVTELLPATLGLVTVTGDGMFIDEFLSEAIGNEMVA